MKFLVITALIVASAASAKVKPREREEGFLFIVDCLKQALDGGVPAAGIPDHNPIELQGDLNFTIDDDFHGLVRAHDVYLYNITDFDVRDLEGAPNRDEFEFDFTFYWPEFTFIGEFDAEGTDDNHYHHNYTNAQIRLVIKGLSFYGTWISTPEFDHVNSFRLKLGSEAVVAQISGVGIYNRALEVEVGARLQGLIDDSHNSDFGGGFPDQINGQWLAPDKQDRLQAIIDNCSEDAGRLYGGILDELRRKLGVAV